MFLKEFVIPRLGKDPDPAGQQEKFESSTDRFQKWFDRPLHYSLPPPPFFPHLNNYNSDNNPKLS